MTSTIQYTRSAHSKENLFPLWQFHYLPLHSQLPPQFLLPVIISSKPCPSHTPHKKQSRGVKSGDLQASPMDQNKYNIEGSSVY
jgi:hypothetical protein